MTLHQAMLDANTAALQHARAHAFASQYKLSKVLMQATTPELREAIRDKTVRIECTSDYDVPHFKYGDDLQKYARAM